MGDDWLSRVGVARWFPIIATFVSGLASGWLIWGGRSERLRKLKKALHHTGFDAPKDEERASALASDAGESAPSHIDTKPVSIKLRAIEAELEAARKELQYDAKYQDECVELLRELDDAVNRANGKLKLVLKSIKRANSRK